jgi:hypothetical protein
MFDGGGGTLPLTAGNWPDDAKPKFVAGVAGAGRIEANRSRAWDISPNATLSDVSHSEAQAQLE